MKHAIMHFPLINLKKFLESYWVLKDHFPWSVVYKKCVSFCIKKHWSLILHNKFYNYKYMVWLSSNGILNIWGFYFKINKYFNQSNRQRCIHLYILLFFRPSLVLFNILCKHLKWCLHEPNTFWPLLHCGGHRGFLLSVSLTELTDRLVWGGGKDRLICRALFWLLLK